MKPSFQGIDITYKSKADNKDIRDLLEKLVPQAAAQLKSYSSQFKGSSVDSTCKKIFDYIKSNFRYVADQEEQIIKLPSALLRYKVGDCKSYSLFTAGILENLGIPYSFVYASYNDNPIPHHVYVQTESGCIIDVVYGTFNKEKKAKYKYKKNMNVRYMAGLGDCGCDKCRNRGMNGKLRDWWNKEVVDPAKDKLNQLQNYGAEQQDAIKEAARKAEEEAKRLRDKALADAKELQDKLKQGSSTIALAPGRALFMLMIENNLDGFASKLSTENTTNLLNAWYKLGGNRTKLSEALKKGASKPAKKLGFLPKLKAIYNKAGINGIGQTDPTTTDQVAQAVKQYQMSGDTKGLILSLSGITGGAIGTAVGPPHGTAIGTGAGAALGFIIIGLTPVIVKAVRKTPDTDKPEEPITTPTNLDPNSVDNINKTYESSKQSSTNTMLYVGGGALLLAGIYFATKKK